MPSRDSEWRVSANRLHQACELRVIFLIARLRWLGLFALAQYYVECLGSLQGRWVPAYSRARHDDARISREAKPHARTFPRRLLQELSARRRMLLLRRCWLQIAKFFCGR